MFCKSTVLPPPEGARMRLLVGSFAQWSYLLCVEVYSSSLIGLILGVLIQNAEKFVSIHQIHHKHMQQSGVTSVDSYLQCWSCLLLMSITSSCQKTIHRKYIYLNNICLPPPLLLLVSPASLCRSSPKFTVTARNLSVIAVVLTKSSKFCLPRNPSLS